MLLTFFLDFEQHTAQATNLLFFIPAALVSIFINSKGKNINFKNAIPLTTFGVLGAITGSLISKNLPVNSLRKFFGLFLIFICLYEIHSYYILYIKNKKKE